MSSEPVLFPFAARVSLNTYDDEGEVDEEVERLVVYHAASDADARRETGLEGFAAATDADLAEWEAGEKAGGELTARELETLHRLARRELRTLANKLARDAAYGGRPERFTQLDRWRATDLAVLLGKLDGMRVEALDEERDAA